MKVVIEQLTRANWENFEQLFSTSEQCRECWCLNHREPAGCATGILAKEKMRNLVSTGKAQGLLAYLDKDCIGWIAIDPMSELVGHDCQSTGKVNEWSIHCLFVRDGFRGQGVSAHLIQAAIQHARANGAKLISAFPIPSENRNRFPANEAEFSGRLSSYTKLGFGTIGAPSEFYQRVELELAPSVCHAEE